MIYCFDLDGTLCTDTNRNYPTAEPYVDRIDVVNRLYDDGHTIIINTARGCVSKKDWFKLTEQQLEAWGVKYHELYVGKKLHADLFVDDKAVSDKEFFDTT